MGGRKQFDYDAWEKERDIVRCGAEHPKDERLRCTRKMKHPAAHYDLRHRVAWTKAKEKK